MYALVLRTHIVTRNNFSRPIFRNEMRIIFLELMNDIKILRKQFHPLKQRFLMRAKLIVNTKFDLLTLICQRRLLSLSHLILLNGN